MAAAPYSIIAIDNRLYIKGKPVFVIDGPYGLKMGDMITQIGNEPATKTNCVDEFKRPVMFSGSITISGVRYLAFKVDTQTVKELNLFDKVEPLYVFYTPHGVNMIFGYNYANGKYLPFKPVFKKVEDSLTDQL